MKFLKSIPVLMLLSVMVPAVFGTTWRAAYPYTQQIAGQYVVVKAIPYDPYAGSPMVGATKVFFKNKLLYTIDQYYREQIFTSDDGQYLAVVYAQNAIPYSSNTSFGISRFNYDKTAIEVFKNGQPFKKYKLKDVVDTTTIYNQNDFYGWNYFFDLDAFNSAEFECKSCKDLYSKRVLQTRDTSEIDLDEWEECRRQCDSAAFKKTARKLSKNAMYVQDNALYILTSQNQVIKLDFSEMTIHKIQLNKIISNKNSFSPPALERKYQKVVYPPRLMPNLHHGKTIAQGLSEFLNKRNSDTRGDSAVLQIYFHTLLINDNGICENVYVSLHKTDNRQNQFIDDETEKKLKAEIEAWIMQQTFSTNTLPKNFQKYNHSNFLYLYYYR